MQAAHKVHSEMI